MSQPWLRDLEDKVQEAASRLRELKDENSELREENRQLSERSVELETQLAGGAAGEGWQEERDEIRERVGRLVDSLSQLLEAE